MEVLSSLLSIIFVVAVVNGDLLGKFVFHGQSDTNAAASLKVIHRPNSVNFAPNPGPIPSDEISSVLTLSMGLSIHKDITWSGLQAGNLFSRPKAVLMLSVDGIPKGDKLKMSASENFAVKMVDDASNIQEIYSLSPKSSLPTHLNTVFEGQSTTVSVSADEKVATAGYSQGKSTTAFWSDRSDSWMILNGKGDLENSLSKNQVLKRIPEVLCAGFQYDKDHSTVVVNTKGLEFSYNLEDHADFNLFSELVYILWQYEELDTNRKGVKDSAPDVYLFTVSALKGLEMKYGHPSKQMQGALLLLEKFIPKMVDGFVNLYGGDILVVGLTLPSDLSFIEEHKEDLAHIFKTLNETGEQPRDFHKFIPELHVASELVETARKKLCEAIHGSVDSLGGSLKFKCATAKDIFRHMRGRRSLLATASKEIDVNLASSYDHMFPVIFNMWFWLLVVLALSVYAVSVSLWCMDPGRDSIIYRLTQQRIKTG